MNFKQFIKLFIVTIIAGLIGGGLRYGITLNPSLITDIKEIAFNSYSIYVYIASAIILSAFISMMVIKIKAKKDNYSDGENSIYSKSQTMINVLMTLNSIAIAASIMQMARFENNLAGLLMFVNVFLGVTNECLIINFIKKVEPSKYGGAMDFSFNYKFIDSLDECELRQAGKTSLKTNATMMILYMLLFLVGTLFNLSYEFFVGVFSVMILQQIVFGINSIKNKSRVF